MNDLHRLRNEYQRRAGLNDDRYAWFNPVYVFQMHSREREILELLKDHRNLASVSGKLLEIGCGNGNVLFDFIKWGLKPEDCVGIDLLPDRLAQAQKKLPDCLLINANGEKLPFSSGTFNIITQFTAFSSVLDPSIKQNMAAEMLRALKPDGAILWYDFWWNPTNPQTAGIKPREIKQLFPGCDYVFRKITLAPPITRNIIPASWQIALLIESLKVLNSHYLVLIQKK